MPAGKEPPTSSNKLRPLCKSLCALRPVVASCAVKISCHNSVFWIWFCHSFYSHVTASNTQACHEGTCKTHVIMYSTCYSQPFVVMSEKPCTTETCIELLMAAHQRVFRAFRVKRRDSAVGTCLHRITEIFAHSVTFLGLTRCGTVLARSQSTFAYIEKERLCNSYLRLSVGPKQNAVLPK